MSSRVGSKVDRLLRAWGFGENVVQKFQEEEIDEEAFDCLDRRLIEILFKTVGAQAKFLKHYQAYLVDKQNSSSEVTELKSEVRVKTESEDQDDLDSSDPGLIIGDSPGPSHQSYESNPANIGNGRLSQEQSPEEEVLEDTPYHVPEMVMSPDASPQYIQAAGSYSKRSYPFGVSFDNDGTKRIALGSDKDENEQDMDVDWSRFPACPFSADWVLGRMTINVTPEGLDSDANAREIYLLDLASPKSSPGRYNLRTSAERSATSSPSVESTFLSCKSPDEIFAAASSSSGEKRTKIPKRLGADAKYLPESKKHLMESCIPNIWPDDIARSLEEIHSRMQRGDVVPTAERLKREHRLYMIRKITGRAVDSGFTAEEFPWVADYVLQVIPALRSSVVPGSTALVVAMKECLRNRRGYEHKKAAKHMQKFATVSSCREAQQRMKQEMTKRAPSINVLKSCLRDARAARIAHAKDSTPTEHLAAYPALRKSELLFWEFSDMVKVPEDVLKYRWTNAVPKLLIHFKVGTEREASIDKTSSMLLQIMSMKMGSSKRGSRGDGIGDVFRVHEYESCIPKTWPDDLQMAIERNSLTSTQRNEIIRRIVDRMLGEGLRGDPHFKAVADVAISRFPCLRSNLTGNLGLVNQLRACAKNKVYQAKRRARKEAGLLVESKKTLPTKRKVKLSEIVENGKPISVVIDESTGDLVLDESEYDVTEALLVLSEDSPSKESYYSPEKKSERQTRSSTGESAQNPHNRELRPGSRGSDSTWSRLSPPTSREYSPDSETAKRTPRKRTCTPRLSKHILAFQATEELEKLDLLTLLKTVSVETRAAVDYYESEGMLTEKHRSWITKVVTNHILHLNTSPTHQEYRIAAQKICQLFPSEQIETYFSPPDEKHRNAWGKLPHKVRNIKYQLSKNLPSKSPQSSPAPSLHARHVVTQKKIPPSVELKDFDENDPKIKAAVVELKHNQESWPEILRNWKVTFPLRFNYLRKNDRGINEYMKQWPVLSLPRAHVLFEQDFKALYPENANGLLLRWKASKKLLIKLVNAEILKSDTRGWSLLQELNKLPNDKSDLTLLTLLSSLCSKRAVYAKGAKTKASAADKPSAEALNTFLIHVAEQRLESCIPRSWPEDLQAAIERGSLAPNHRNEIVRRIVDRMIDEGLRGDPVFRDVATLALARIPTLKSKLVAGSLGLVHQLKTCYKNKTHHARKRARKEAEGTLPGKSPTVSAPTPIKSSLRQCRKARLSEARACSATEHLRRFPVLQEPEMILWEFEEIVNYKVDDLRARWRIALPKIQRLLLQTPDPDASYSHDKATISVLLHIEDYFSSKRKTKKAPTRKILQMYQADNPSKCMPSATDPPSLIAFCDKEEVQKVTTYLNNVPVFTGGAVDAFLLLTALYWVFSFDFTSNCRPTMTFLFAVLMPTLMTNDVAKYRSVLSALEEIDKL